VKRLVIESLRTKTPLIWCYSLSLLLVAVWLRWDITPKTYFADELIPLAVVTHMQDSNTLDTNWEKADWRGDFAGAFYKLHQYNFSSYLSSLFWLRAGADSVGLESVPDLTLYRLASLACQVGCMLLVFAIAGQLAGNTAGLLAASFIAVMPQAVVDAHYARPESFVMLLVAMGCWLALQVDHRRSGLNGFLEALVWGVAFACKFSFFPMALLACGGRLVRQRYAHVFLLWCAGFLVGIALTAPYILLDIDGFFHGVRLLLDQYTPQAATVGWFASVFPSAHQLFPYLTVFFGLPVLILLVVSCRQQKIKARCFTGVCLLVSLFYVLLFARQGVFFERNLSHLLPLWSVLFALGFVEIFRSLEKLWQLVGVAMLFLLWPLYLSVQIDRYFFRNLETVKQGVFLYQQNIQKKFDVGKVVIFPIIGDQTIVDNMGKKEILRVPQHKLDGLLKVNRDLEYKHFYQVAYIELPLSYLPYNQLQINHFPPAYVYYLREAVANVGGVQ
jgi:hypothetical protein